MLTQSENQTQLQVILEQFITFHSDSTRLRADLWQIYTIAIAHPLIEDMSTTQREELMFTMSSVMELCTAISDYGSPLEQSADAGG